MKKNESLFNNIDKSKLLKRSNYTNLTDDIVTRVISGSHFFFHRLDYVRFKSGIDWDYQHESSSNTYQLYLHSLEVLSHLTNYYNEKKDKVSLIKANEIINDWFNYNENQKLSEFCWYNHTVANRAIIITYFYYSAKDVLHLNERLFYDYLVKHAEFLYDNKNYVRNNHGIMMDRSLIQLSIVLQHPNQNRWRDQALYRIKEAFYRDFSSKGVHFENSPEYHSLVRTLYTSTNQMIKQHSISLGENINQKLTLTGEYLKYITKPNGDLPIIGDTDLRKVNVAKKFGSFLDSEAGVAILQSRNSEDMQKSTWLSFVCGYGSKTHKHNDDLSFTLYYKGKDIFIDSGKYNYNEKDKIRKYIRSPLAHNTLSIYGKSYEIKDPYIHRGSIEISDFHKNEYYEMIKGRNFSYKDVKLTRTLMFFKPDILIVVDKVESKETEKAIQIFNLAPHIKIVEAKNNRVLLKSDDDFIELKQVIGQCEVNKYRGDKDTPRAIISEKFGQIIDNSQIEFSQIGESNVFVTLITMGQNNERVSDVTYNTEKRILTIDVDGTKLTVSP